MYSQLSSSNVLNVLPFRSHIDVGSACPHEVGTFSNKDIFYTKNNNTFIRYGLNHYTYKDKEFELDNNSFLSDDMNFILPSRTYISTIERVMLSLGFPLKSRDISASIDIQTTTFKDILYTLTALSLQDLSLVPKNMALKKRIRYGEVILSLYVLVSSGSGRISSKNSNIRFLNEQDTLQLKSKLFNLSDEKEKKYQAGVFSMKYIPTKMVESIFDNCIELLKSLDFVNNDIEAEDLDFTVSIEKLHEIRTRDIMLILNDCIGYNNAFIIRPILQDEQNSRVYSVFTSISSETRKLLGYTNYDIGSALQTICLQLVENQNLYPLHQELMRDKKAFRQKVADETGQDLPWVKTELSKIDNLDKVPKRYANYPTLQAYFKESLPMRKEIIDNAEPAIKEIAYSHAKPKWEKGDWNEEKKEYNWTWSTKKESSVFFFIWTQWERQIRHAMMECFTNPQACHQVHDAVYSREDIAPRVIEAKVFDKTEFKVTISKD